MLKLKSQKFSDIFRHLFCGWLLAALTEYLLLPSALQQLEGLNGLAAMSFPRLCIVTVVVAFILYLLAQKVAFVRIERFLMVGGFALLSVAALIRSFSWGLLAACALVLTILAVYVVKGHDLRVVVQHSEKSATLLPHIATIVLALGFVGFVSAWGISRVLSFSTPNYDFGIFSQMFYNMKETGLPMTTVERDGLLSHFAVHVSPIYYLMLPFYCLAPTPATLQVLQAIVLASAVIPMWLIGKRHGFSPWLRVLMCAAVMLYPTTAGGTSYDLHENCFLLPLVLWLLYAIDMENPWLCGLFGILTLCVKEDAAVYVAVAGLYLLVRTLATPCANRTKNILTGLGLLLGSIVWFAAVTGYLAAYGDGVMTYRYQNFMYDGGNSLLTVVKAVLMSPMKMLFECVDPEKTNYLLQTMLPLLGLPFITRKFDRYILLIPYILLNLMSDYVYQHDIFFQYNFGSSAFLLYLTAVNLSDLRINWVRVTATAAAVAVSLIYFCSLIIPKGSQYIESHQKYKDYYTGVAQALDQVPDDTSVATGTFYVTYLSQRSTLYDIRYCSKEHLLDCEFVVLKCNSENDYKKYTQYGNSGFDGIVNLLEDNGYELYYQYGSVLVIYRQKP